MCESQSLATAFFLANDTAALSIRVVQIAYFSLKAAARLVLDRLTLAYLYGRLMQMISE
jgi:hypothetical protein